MQDNLNSMAPVSSLAVEDRSEFIWKCYAHVVGAIFALIAVEYYLFSSGVAGAIAGTMMQSPMLVMIGFVALSWGAGHVAHRLESTAAKRQYAHHRYDERSRLRGDTRQGGRMGVLESAPHRQGSRTHRHRCSSSCPRARRRLGSARERCRI